MIMYWYLSQLWTFALFSPTFQSCLCNTLDFLRRVLIGLLENTPDGPAAVKSCEELLLFDYLGRCPQGK